MEDPCEQRCEALPWDSEFWGFPVARLNGGKLSALSLGSCLAWCKSEGVRCLYFAADGSDPETLRLADEAGFRFVDLRIDLEHRVAPPGAITAEPSGIRPARSEDMSALAALARRSHEDTRFFKDSRFPREKARDLYVKWIEADLACGAVLVDDPDGTPEGIRGYVTCRMETAQLGRIGLIAVDGAARRSGAGTRLLGAALAWFAARGASSARVATQGTNVAALRLYEAAGFRVRETRVWFHKWFDPAADRSRSSLPP